MVQRKSNMELLRIISISMIVIFHCAYHSGFSFAPGFIVNKLVIKYLWMLGELGVDLFILISGFFMASGRFKWKKLIRLLVEVQFYYWITVFIAYKVNFSTPPTGKKEILLSFFPVITNRWWFTTAYILIYLLSPYLNLLVWAMDEKTYRRFLLTTLTLFCVIPTFFGFFYNTTESLLFFNRFIWLVIVYFLGAYIYRIYKKKDSKYLNRKCMVWLIAASSVSMVVSILLIDRFSGFFKRLGTSEIAYFWHPNTILMVGLSVGIFGLFLHIEIPYNLVINTIASTTLGIYLLHDGILRPWIWQTLFQCANYQESPLLPARILAVSAAVIVVGVTVDLLRQWVEKYTLRPLLESKAAIQFSKVIAEIDSKIL